MNPYYFRRDKTAILGAIKTQLLFSEGKYQLLNSRNKVPFPRIFYHLNFQLTHPNRSNSVGSHKCHFKRPQNEIRKQKTALLAFSLFFSLGAPDICPTGILKEKGNYELTISDVSCNTGE